MHFFLSGAPPAPLRLNLASKTVKNTASFTCSALGGVAKTEKQKDLQVKKLKNAKLAKKCNIIYIIYNIQVYDKRHNIFAVIRGNGISFNKNTCSSYHGQLRRTKNTQQPYDSCVHRYAYATLRKLRLNKRLKNACWAARGS